MAAPPVEPSFGAGPPAAPPRGPAPGQRRFNFLIVGLTILVAVGLVGGLLIYNRPSPKKAIPPQAEDDVRQAYLAYSAAAMQELSQLELTPVQPYLTIAGAEKEETVLQKVAKTGFRYRGTVEHNPQILVYSGGQLASVDDLMVRHTVPLDLTTAQPVGTERSDVLHQSYGLKKVGNRWLIDSIAPFGTAPAEPPLRISFAAASLSQPVNSVLIDPIKQAFARYWSTYAQVFRSLAPTALGTVETDPLLTQDQKLIEDQRQKSRGYVVKVEHNYRVARQDDGTYWVYDTYADSSYSLDLTSGRPVNVGPPEVVREGYEFRRVGETWMLVSSVLYK